MGKWTGKKYRNIGIWVLLLWVLAGLCGCGIQGMDPADESVIDGNVQDDEVGENEDEEAEVVLSLEEGEIRSIWMEKDVLYAFVASGDKKKTYGIYEVRDGGLLEETPYSEVMEQWSQTEMKKARASSFEYEARLGKNDVVYLLGRDDEENVGRCYWMEKTFYTDILFYKRYEGRYIRNIEISRTGKIYLENTYGGYMIPYGNFEDSIGVGLSSWQGRTTVLGEQRMYQLVEGWIYVWEITTGASLGMIRCESLTDGSTPVFVDKDDNIYLVGNNGLAYLPRDGSIWEILVDTDEEGFSGSAFDLRQIWVYEEDLYLSGIDKETGQCQILRRKIPGKAVKK